MTSKVGNFGKRMLSIGGFFVFLAYQWPHNRSQPRHGAKDAHGKATLLSEELCGQVSLVGRLRDTDGEG